MRTGTGADAIANTHSLPIAATISSVAVPGTSWAVCHGRAYLVGEHLQGLSCATSRPTIVRIWHCRLHAPRPCTRRIVFCPETRVIISVAIRGASSGSGTDEHEHRLCPHLHR